VLGLLALALGGAGASASAQDLAPVQEPADEEPGDAWASLQTVADADAYVVGQVIDLRLRLSLDVEFFATRALPLFRRPMDLPLQIEAPWWDELPGTLPIDAADTADTLATPDMPVMPDTLEGERRSLALGDRIVDERRVEERLLGDRTFAVLELRRCVLPDFAGTLTVPAPSLHFAFATEFRDDLVQGRVPLDRRAAYVTGTPLELTIHPLPEDGRPPGFTGAVGRFTVQADAQPRALSVGEQLVLTLSIDGEGNLSTFDAPPLPPIEGFTGLGRLSDEAGPPRTIRYGLVARDASVGALGPLPFAFYDPEAETYRVLETTPIPVRVLAAASVDDASSAAPEQPAPAADAPDDTPDDAPRTWLLAVSVAVIVALAWATSRAWRSVSAQTPAADVPAPGADALAAFRESARSAQAESTQAFVAYLAARLGCSQAEVVGPGLAERLVTAGAPRDLSSRIASRLAELLASRYGGHTPAAGGADVRELAEQLEAALQR
jgi:hypothetical protein